jgi:hypothetical protein
LEAEGLLFWECLARPEDIAQYKNQRFFKIKNITMISGRCNQVISKYHGQKGKELKWAFSIYMHNLKNKTLTSACVSFF